ncbi:hydrogenase expression/formation protein HypE [Desulfurococcaceae archaeon MEX13E-LK6-19]|nr:hydrogenase expression/formation protein HypE [Desulfurococcaceae archaeon MEX13E-LK6-19]
MEYIKLSHGGGAKESWEIIEKLIVSRVPVERRKTSGGFGIDVLDDGAVIKTGDKYIVVTTDSFTVNPIFFPGGNIGGLAASGTINDLVVMGAKPVAFMDTIVVEEGFPLQDLEEIIGTMVNIILSEGLALIGGDFKVMPHGSIDKIVITGIGIGFTKKPIIDNKISPGDKIIVTSTIAEHGTAIMAAQLGLLDEIKDIKSDSRPLTRTVLPVVEKYIDYIHAARDPTRGGIAATLSEWVKDTDLYILFDRSLVPIRDEVKEFLDALGVDPLSMACEGVAVLAVDESVAEEVVAELHRHGEKYATIIGEVKKAEDDVIKGKVVAYTEVGGTVLIEPKSVNVPRIC